jgi:hypothetical protein
VYLPKSNQPSRSFPSFQQHHEGCCKLTLGYKNKTTPFSPANSETSTSSPSFFINLIPGNSSPSFIIAFPSVSGSAYAGAVSSASSSAFSFSTLSSSSSSFLALDFDLEGSAFVCLAEESILVFLAADVLDFGSADLW